MMALLDHELHASGDRPRGGVVAVCRDGAACPNPKAEETVVVACLLLIDPDAIRSHAVHADPACVAVWPAAGVALLRL